MSGFRVILLGYDFECKSCVGFSVTNEENFAAPTIGNVFEDIEIIQFEAWSCSFDEFDGKSRRGRGVGGACADNRRTIGVLGNGQYVD